MIYKSCNKKITYDLVDLGSSPIANNYLKTKMKQKLGTPSRYQFVINVGCYKLLIILSLS